MQPSHWKWQLPSRRLALSLLGIFAGVTVANGLAVWLAMLSDDDGPISPWRPLVWEGTSALALWVAVPIVLTACVNAPVPTRRWGRLLVIHLGGYLATTSVHIAVMMTARHVVYPLLGWGPYEAGLWPLRLPMEALRDLVSYGMLASLLTLTEAWRARQRQALEAAQLEGALRSAELQNLSANLHPHFLFNALNTISSVMYEDLARTDRLIADLGELLRQSLDAKAPTWPLRAERAYVERYVAVLQARFGPRLGVEWQVDPALDASPVPRFAVQTLVENAVKHNADAGAGLRVQVQAVPDGTGQWRIEVLDDGRGFDAARRGDGPGIGLEQLQRRIRLLHGDGARLDAGDRPEGGARVVLRLPRSDG